MLQDYAHRLYQFLPLGNCLLALQLLICSKLTISKSQVHSREGLAGRIHEILPCNDKLARRALMNMVTRMLIAVGMTWSMMMQSWLKYILPHLKRMVAAVVLVMEFASMDGRRTCSLCVAGKTQLLVSCWSRIQTKCKRLVLRRVPLSWHQETFWMHGLLMLSI